MAILLHHITQSFICGLLMLFGSGASIAFLLLLLRFRDLRTMTNLLLAQVAVSNFMTLTVGLSIFIDFEILELHQLESKFSASIFLFFERYFNIVNGMLMVLVCIDRFLAIQFDLRYTAKWRSKHKIICSIVICWLSFMILIVLDLTVNNPNLGKVPVWKYKLATSNTLYFDSVKAVIPAIFLILTILTWRSLNYRRNAIRRLGGRKNVVIESDEMKAAKTVAWIGLWYSCCLGLAILFQHLSKGEMTKRNNIVFRWFYFLAQFFATIPSTSNLFITWARTKRLRRAFKQLYNDPCGSSKLIEFQQHPPINLAPRPPLEDRKITRVSNSIRKDDRGVKTYIRHKGCGCSEDDITNLPESAMEFSSCFDYSPAVSNHYNHENTVEELITFKNEESSSSLPGEHIESIKNEKPASSQARGNRRSKSFGERKRSRNVCWAMTM